VVYGRYVFVFRCIVRVRYGDSAGWDMGDMMRNVVCEVIEGNMKNLGGITWNTEVMI